MSELVSASSLEEAWEVKEVREKELLLFSLQETENQAKYR
jgi:hypothetical protein